MFAARRWTHLNRKLDQKLDQTSLYRRWALAQRLLPDADVAADLFMLATSEADLIRRAHAWLRRRELPVESVDLAAELPELSQEEQEHALHLARRGRIKRLMVRGGLGVAAALVLALTLLLGPLRAAAPALAGVRLAGLAEDLRVLRGLGAAPVYGERPVAEWHGGQKRLLIHRAEATPVAVRVWWSLTGPDVRNSDSLLKATLRLNSRQRVLSHSEHQTHSPRGDIVFGVTTFSVVAATNDRVLFRVEGVPGAPAVELSAPLAWSADADARVIRVGRGDSSPITSFFVESITIAADYTAIDYVGPRWTMRSLIVPQMMDVEADGAELRWRASRRLDDVDGQSTRVQDILDPLPAGVSKLVLRYPTRMYRSEELEMALTDSRRIQQLTIGTGGTVSGVLVLDSEVRFVDRPRLVDDRGTEHRATLVNSQQQGGPFAFSATLPGGVNVVGLRVNAATPIEPITLEVNLPK